MFVQKLMCVKPLLFPVFVGNCLHICNFCDNYRSLISKMKISTTPDYDVLLSIPSLGISHFLLYLLEKLVKFILQRK